MSVLVLWNKSSLLKNYSLNEYKFRIFSFVCSNLRELFLGAESDDRVALPLQSFFKLQAWIFVVHNYHDQVEKSL